MLRSRQQSEAKNEIGLTRQDIHGIAMVIPIYEKISHRYLCLCRDTPSIITYLEIIKDRYRVS